MTGTPPQLAPTPSWHDKLVQADQQQQDPAPVGKQWPEAPRVSWEERLRQFDTEDRAAEDRAIATYFQGYAKDNPDLAGEAQRLGVQLGLGTEVVLQNIDKVRGIMARHNAQLQANAATNPILRRKLLDPEFARIAHDDALNLGFVENLWAQSRVGWLQIDATVAVSDKDKARADAGFEELKELPQGSGGIFGGLARQLGQYWRILPEAIETGVKVGAAGAVPVAIASLGPQGVATLPTAAGTFVTGLIAGATARAGQLMYKASAGAFIHRAIAANIDEDVARAWAPVVGTVATGLEFGGGASFLLPVKGLIRRAFTDRIVEGLAQQTGRNAAMQFLRSVGVVQGGEISTELLQQILERGTVEFLGGSEANAQSWGAELADTVVETFYQSFLLSAASPTVQLVDDAKRAKRAGLRADLFAGITGTTEKARTIERNPDKAEELLRQMSDGSPAGTVYIDGAAMAEVFRQAGKTKETLNATVPGLGDQLEKVVADGVGDVVMPAATFHAKLVRTEEGKELMQHIRLDPFDPSLAEAGIGADEATRGKTEKMAQEAADEAKKDEEFAKSSQALQDKLQKQFEGTGRMPNEQARQSAALIRLFHDARAQQRGITPEESFAEDEVSIVAGKPTSEMMQQFAGPKSQTANLFDFAAAKKLEAEGADATTIRTQTGWFRGADKMWRYEISDANAKFAWPKLNRPQRVQAAKRSGATDVSGDMHLGDVLEHPALLRAYPQLAKIEIEKFSTGPMGGGPKGFASALDNVIGISDRLSNEEALSVLLHEIQHLLQFYEGFAQGGASRMFDAATMEIIRQKDFKTALAALQAKYPDDVDLYERYKRAEEVFMRADVGSRAGTAKELMALQDAVVASEGANAMVLAEMQSRNLDEFEAYMRLAGEVEARNVQTRQDLDIQQREALGAEATEDRPRASMVFAFGLPQKIDTTFRQEAAPEQEHAPTAKEQFAAGTVLAKDAAKTEKRKQAPTTEAALGTLARLHKGAQRVLKFLLPAERGLVNKRNIKTLLKVAAKLPSATEMASVAHAGRVKRGWYLFSSRALELVFKEDAHRFAYLLAAMSPQTSVEANLWNTLSVWNAWNKAGRPTDEKVILKIMGKAVQGGTEKSVLGGWRNNVFRALTTTNPKKIVLSGPKVNSFAENNLGNADEVTNDTWMANYALISQRLFSGVASAPLPGKGPGYLATASVTRDAAAEAGWKPAEVQETVWSFAKALTEKAERLTRSALDILTSGELTHEDIAGTPDFELLFSQSQVHRQMLIDGGYEQNLRAVEAEVAARQTEKLTGSVYVGTEEQLADLRRTAKRLDALIAQRAHDKTRAAITVNLSAATTKIPGVDNLHKQAMAGDQSAATLLQEIAIDMLRFVTAGLNSAEVAYTPVSGVYDGVPEPAVGLRMSFLERERPAALRALRQFALNFNQQQFHVRGDAGGGRAGTVHGDGSYNTEVFTFLLKTPLDRAALDTFRAATGLRGMTVTPDGIEVYFVGDPNDAQARSDFQAAVARGQASLGANGRRVARHVARLWAYGTGDGATHSFESIAGKFQPPKGDYPSRTAQRVASRLARHEVRGTKQAAVLTEDQVELQRRIAQAYEAMSLNNLADPRVRRAYTELATELLEQYDALPIKVEVWTAKGQPYKNSAAMRQDVVARNRLFIFATEAEKFGPPGVTYDNHPLLADSGRVDANGRKMLVNDLLRAVHDYYAHSIQANQFGPKGEEAAWKTHMEMTRSPWARWALTSETRGQNSWVNFNRPELAGMPLPDRPFSEQKVDLLPIEFLQIGDAEVDRVLAQLPGSDALELGVAPPSPPLPVPENAQPMTTMQLFGQSKKEGSRGGFDPKTNTIVLNEPSPTTEGSDASTAVHESLHYFLKVYSRLAALPNAPESIVRDMTEILKWFGVADLATWNGMSMEQQRPHHEALANRFEIYMATGEAPTPELKPLFERIRLWFVRVYAALTRQTLEANYEEDFGRALPELTPEVREVFDRMLAAEAGMAKLTAERKLGPAFRTQQEAGMNDKQWADYNELWRQAQADGVALLQAASLRDMGWTERAKSKFLRATRVDAKEKRAPVQEKVEAEVKQRQVVRLTDWLRTGVFRDQDGSEVKIEGGHKLNRDEVSTRMLAEGGDAKLVEKLDKHLSKDGLAIDAVAGSFNYTSVDAMLADLVRFDSTKELVARETDARMLEEHGELVDPDQIQDAMERALHNEARRRAVATELAALERSGRPARAILNEARDAAERTLRGKKVSELQPRIYSASAAKAARNSVEAMKRGNSAEAWEWKSRELYMTQLALAAADAKEEMQRAVRSFARFRLPPEKLHKAGRNVDYVLVGRTLLGAFGLDTGSALPLKHVEQIKRYDPAFYDEVIQPLLDRHTHGNTLQSYRDMTWDEFQVLRDALDELWHRSKRDFETKVGAEKVKRADAIAELNAQRLKVMGEPPRGLAIDPSDRQLKVDKLKTGAAWLKRVQHWARKMDGGAADGPFQRFIWRQIRDSSIAYRVQKAELWDKFGKLVKTLDLRATMIAAPELGFTFRDKAKLMGAMLHAGSLSNLERMLTSEKSTDGTAWGARQPDGTVDTSRWDKTVEDLIQRGILTRADFDFLQAVWDLNESLKGPANKTLHDLKGVYMEPVEARAFVTPFGTYRGGYVPSKADPSRNFFVDATVGIDALASTANGLLKNRPSTAAPGFTTTRKEVVDEVPRQRDLFVELAHLDNVLRFIHLAAPVQDALRIINDPTFAGPQNATDPHMIRQVLLPWLESVRNQRMLTPSVMDILLVPLRTIAGAATMFLNLANALQQGTGLSNANVYVPARQLARAAVDLRLGFSSELTDMILSKSAAMRVRWKLHVGVMQDDLGTALEPGLWKGTMRAVSKHAYFLQSMFQNQVDKTVWLGAYRESLEQAPADMSPEVAERAAIAHADDVVILSQGEATPESAARYEKGNSLLKGMSQFTGYWNTVLNQIASQNTGSQKAVVALKALTVPALIGSAITLAFQGGLEDTDDDDDYWDEITHWLFATQARAAAGLLPVAGAMLTSMAQSEGNRLASSPSFEMVRRAVAGGYALFNRTFGYTDQLTSYDINDLLAALTLATRLPFTKLGASLNYLQDVAAGEVQPSGGLDYIRGLISGRASPGTR